MAHWPITKILSFMYKNLTYAAFRTRIKHCGDFIFGQMFSPNSVNFFFSTNHPLNKPTALKQQSIIVANLSCISQPWRSPKTHTFLSAHKRITQFLLLRPAFVPTKHKTRFTLVPAIFQGEEKREKGVQFTVAAAAAVSATNINPQYPFVHRPCT